MRKIKLDLRNVCLLFLMRFQLDLLETIPQLVSSFGDTIIWDISVGAEFLLALDSKGDVWGWGNNSEGQLGLGHTDPQPVPIRIPHLEGRGVAQISAGK